MKRARAPAKRRRSEAHGAAARDVRDVDETPFAPILAALLRRVPGAYAAALVDLEGETVDYAGNAAAFDIRVAAAHARILLGHVEGLHAAQDADVLGRACWLVVRGAKKTLLARVLPDGYALAVLLRKRAGFTASSRAFAACERDLAREAGWERRPAEIEWYPVDVHADRLGRPRRVGTSDVRVLGALVGLRPGEQGYRVRTAEGNEITLLREAAQCWYADQRLDAS